MKTACKLPKEMNGRDVRHIAHNVMEAAHYSVEEDLRKFVKSILRTEDMQTARMLLKHTLDTYGNISHKRQGRWRTVHRI